MITRYDCGPQSGSHTTIRVQHTDFIQEISPKNIQIWYLWRAKKREKTMFTKLAMFSFQHIIKIVWICCCCCCMEKWKNKETQIRLCETISYIIYNTTEHRNHQQPFAHQTHHGNIFNTRTKIGWHLYLFTVSNFYCIKNEKSWNKFLHLILFFTFIFMFSFAHADLDSFRVNETRKQKKL